MFYLKRWLLGGDTIVEFSRPHGSEVKPRRTHPSGTGFVDRLYEMRGLPPELAQQIEEKVFRTVDTRAADVMKMIHAGHGPQSVRDRTAWTQFLISLMLRTPEELRRYKALYAANFLKSERKYERLYAAQRGPNDPKTFTEYLAGTPKDLIEQSAMQAFVFGMEARNSSNHIMRMKWGHIQLPFFCSALMTSDRPIISEGLIKDDAHLILPIGPKRIFYAVNQTSTLAKIMTIDPNQLTARINFLITAHAHKYVYATTDTALAFVQNYMSIDPAALGRRRAGQKANFRKITKANLARGDRLLRED